MAKKELSNLRIIRLEAENYKRLRAVRIDPKGNVVEITGRNGQGKTSILDAIFEAVKQVDLGTPMPIRKGEEKARIRLDMGDLVVERKFSEKGSTLIVANAEGAQYSSPQTMLNALLGALSFEPLKFAQMRPRDQYDALKGLVKMEVDVEALELKNNADFNRRTEINRDAKAKRAQADGIVVPAGLPDAVIDKAALLTDLTNASTHNTDIAQRRANRESATKEIETIRASVATAEIEAVSIKDTACGKADRELEEAIARARAAREAAINSAHERMKQTLEGCKAQLARATDIEAKLSAAPPLPAPIDVAALRAQIDAAEATNAGIAKQCTQAILISEAQQLEAKSKELTEAIEARDAAKVAAISSAKMPVAGLGFGAGHITFNGVPFEQASSAEKLRVSLAIAMAGNPTMRVIRIQDGSLLDEDSMAIVAEMAAAHGFQVWVEAVDSSGTRGIVIEDGAVKTVN